MYRYRIYTPSRQKLLDKILIVKKLIKSKTIHLTSGLFLFCYLFAYRLVLYLITMIELLIIIMSFCIDTQV